ncbi:MAG: sodium:proton antiporter [Muribaculaceae bacterium]|nr:sodium:proton antiporter [Muribaculaceae bacterium]
MTESHTNTNPTTNLTDSKQIMSPSLLQSLIPVVFLFLFLLSILIFKGASAINEWSPVVLLSSAAVSLMAVSNRLIAGKQEILSGLQRSSRQILPAVVILFFIAILTTTWMLGGIVPTFIHYGLNVMTPTTFLMAACGVSACISVLIGSSWTTIATVGVAFMGIGKVLGFSDPWIAGAIISGAYFGDKVSPLSDTTVVASSSCGVNLFTHIRYLMFTAGPAMGIALIVFLTEGLLKAHAPAVASESGLLDMLHSQFNITPWVLLVPGITFMLIICRLNTTLTLAISSGLGVVSMLLTQPQLPFGIEFFNQLWSGVSFNTPDESFNNLVSTGGILGMLPTIFLVLSAMIFGGVMIGTGMLKRIADEITRRLHRPSEIVGATLGSGLMLNSCTADQYLSLIIGANMYRGVYEKSGLEARLLSRSLEDSISVTSVLIPWNSCGLTQSAVLGVPTLVYLPYCVFNYLSPLMSFWMVSVGWKLRNKISERRIRLIPAGWQKSDRD